MPYIQTDNGKLKSVKPEKGLEIGPMEPEQPTVEFDESELPQIKDWKVGETYMIQIQVKMSKLEDEEEGLCATFDVLKIKPV